MQRSVTRLACSRTPFFVLWAGRTMRPARSTCGCASGARLAREWRGTRAPAAIFCACRHCASNKKCILAHDPQTHRVSLFGRARTCALEYSGGTYQINCLQCARIDRYANYIGFHGGWSGLKSPHPASPFAAPILKFLVDLAALSLSHARSHLMLRE